MPFSNGVFVHAGRGRNPVWNEKFIFRVENPESGYGIYNKFTLKIMDKDRLFSDDFIGQSM